MTSSHQEWFSIDRIIIIFQIRQRMVIFYPQARQNIALFCSQLESRLKKALKFKWLGMVEIGINFAFIKKSKFPYL